MSSHLKCKNKPVRVSRTSRVSRDKDSRDKDSRDKDSRDKDNRDKDSRDKDNRDKDNRDKMRATARKGPAAVKRKKIKTAKTARVRRWMILSIRP